MPSLLQMPTNNSSPTQQLRTVTRQFPDSIREQHRTHKTLIQLTYPSIPTMFPQYPSIYPQNPQTTYSNPNDPKCPDGWKKDGNCKTTGICVDRKEHCFYGAICCQIDSKIRQKTTKQNPKTGKTETDWCPNYSHKDGTCSGIKFFCADLSEECLVQLETNSFV
uniref:WAP domain-containing protein n=1 Tax=Globodera pallida TaxID=36090 RepID=A0A183CMU6_GLOPA